MLSWLRSLFSTPPKSAPPKQVVPEPFDPQPAMTLDWLDTAALERALESSGTAQGDAVPLKWISIGTLKAPTGKIYVGDPLGINMEDEPFFQTVPPGNYDVRICTATFDYNDERIALAQLILSDAPPAEWKLALTEKQNPNSLSEGEYYGYGVDGGTGCFFDGDSLKAVDDLLASESPEGDMGFELFVAEMEKNSVPTRDWANYKLDETGRNIIMFSSGWGDGFYPTYIGYDASGAVTSFITDFLVLDILSEVAEG